MARISWGLVLALFLVAVPREASALIRGDVGNTPVNDPGWPKGAASIFNNPGRIAWWEGPPFGGGERHAECRGGAATLSLMLAEFAALDVKVKRVVLHDGVGHSFWLAPNREPEKLENAKMDWSFTVWQEATWKRLHAMPADLNPTDPDDTSPPARIDVYTGGLRWSDVKVPEGISVVDQRLEAHGFTTDDGIVMEGDVVDLAKTVPLAATVRLERVEPQKKGGYQYPLVAETKADARGHWVLKHVPAAWVRVVVSADGFASRVVGYAQFDGQPRWQSYEAGLAPAATVSGRVVDEDGKPLAGVDVRLDNLQAATGGRYDTPNEATIKTGDDGRFVAVGVPAGKASIWIHKTGYVRPGLGLPITIPASDLELTMKESAVAIVTVDFTGKTRPEGYMVSMKPEGGEVIGSYGGSGNINDKNQMTFANVPPGRYTFLGRPNPGSDAEETEPVTVELKGGGTSAIPLKAR